MHGLNRFLDILDSRKDEKNRHRGLVTVSNHVSIMDDPLVFGVLPNRYLWDPNNMRWSLGSHDICFKNRIFDAFFSYGNTLPIHRIAHSRHGGLFQPTMTQAIRLLSDPYHAFSSETAHNTNTGLEETNVPLSDPFSSSQLTYSTTGSDRFPAPSAYPSRRFSWIHIFPEGMIHQHPDKVMRYFKWGVARLILEAEPCPDVLPMWIDGLQDVYSNDRSWPRPIPRPGKNISITFGNLVDIQTVFEPYRQRWRELKATAKRKRLYDGYCPSTRNSLSDEVLGEIQDEELKYGAEAEQLRVEVTLAVRNEVLKVRRSRGLPDEDPKRGFADTFKSEGGRSPTRIAERKRDRSSVQDW